MDNAPDRSATPGRLLPAAAAAGTGARVGSGRRPASPDPAAVGAVRTAGWAALLLGAVLGTPASAQAPRSPDRGAAAVCTLSPPPNTLWSLAQCCVTDLKSNPSCVLYEPRDEYVLVKDNDPSKPTAYLIIPSKQVTGIEDPQVLSLPFLDIWEDGWYRSARHPGKGDNRTGLAINSKPGRDQGQLHIHISCARADVRGALQSNDRRIGEDPTKPFSLQLGPHGNTYEVVRVASLTSANSPFNVIQSFPGVKGHMELQSIAVVGTQTSRPGYYVLNTYAHGTNRGSAEELLDQTCAD